MSIYADYNATAPIKPEVAQYMMELAVHHPGNSASFHRYGRFAQELVEEAKVKVANLIGADAQQIFFTSGATEANNWVLKGVAAGQSSGTLAIGATEHESVLGPAAFIKESFGWSVDKIAVDSAGQVSADQLPQANLISIMWANNETGTINALESLTQAAHAKGALIHTDAAQAVGKVPVSFHDSGVDFMSVSAHKLGGPMGVGALVMKNPRTPLVALIHGGGHQLGYRSGTENVAAIAGFGMACEMSERDLASTIEHTALLRQQFEAGILEMPGVQIFAVNTPRLPNTSFFAMEGISGEMAVMSFDKMGIAVSGGAACGRHKEEQASHVLVAMGIPKNIAECAVRVSFGPQNTTNEVAHLLAATEKVINKLRLQARR